METLSAEVRRSVQDDAKPITWGDKLIEASMMFMQSNGSSGERAILEQRVDDQADLLRTELDRFNYDQRSTINTYFNYAAPYYIKHQKQDDNESWVGWLVNTATTRQLAEVFRWHDAASYQQQHCPVAEHTIEQERREYKGAIHQAVSEGWLHEDAILAIGRVDDIQVRLGDCFTMVEADAGGFCRSGEDWIAVSGSTIGIDSPIGLRMLERNIRHAQHHELNHAVLQQWKYKNIRWINEALTEHIAQALKKGSPGIVAPDARPDDDLVYAEERQLLDALLTCGAVDIPVQTLTRAYAERTGNGLLNIADFRRMVKQAWGEPEHPEFGKLDVVDWLNIRMNEMEIELQKQGVSEKTARLAALMDTEKALRNRPDCIFGENYTLPQAA